MRVDVAEARLVGRFERVRGARGPTAESVRFAWSGSTIVARFTGATSIAMLIRMPPLPPHTVTIDGGAVRLVEKIAAYSISIDDRAPVTIGVTPDVERYELAAGLDPSAIHEARIAREPEAFAGVHEFFGFELAPTGKLLPTKPAERRLEWVGDSIMCGYGALGRDATCPFTYETERATVAYPMLVARALGADATVLCWSGRGVYRNYDGSLEETMPALYERVLPDPMWAAESYAFAPGPDVPDTVIIGLGTNDFLGGEGRKLDIPAFERAYVDFLARIRRARPDARLVVTTSPMIGPPVRATVKEALERIVTARRQQGERRLEVVDLDYEGDRAGCDGHPNAEMHRLLAKQIEAVLRAPGPIAPPPPTPAPSR